MANPQPDKYTRISNEWLEAFIVAQYPGSIKNFVLIVARETWGWNRTWRAIPISRFCELMRVDSRRVYQVRDDALRHNLICIENTDAPGGAPRYRVQKDYIDWIEYHVTDKARNSGKRLKDVLHSQSEGRTTQASEGRTSQTYEGRTTLHYKDERQLKTNDSDSLFPNPNDPPKPERPASTPDLFQQGLSLYTKALRTADSDPAAEAVYSNTCAAYGDEAALAAAAITCQKFADEPDKPNGGSVASYLQRVARTQADKLKAEAAACPVETDPVRAEFTRLKGTCPEEAFDRADWHQQLAKFRAEREVAASA